MRLKRFFSISFMLICVLGLVCGNRAAAQTFTTLHAFTGNNGGCNPYGNLIMSGNTLYGTVGVACTNDSGGIFAMDVNGSNFVYLHAFNGQDGAVPYGGLILCGNVLYGTTSRGGTNSDGTVFSMNTDGSGYTVLHNFSASSDGGILYSGVALSSNTLYGVTSLGGTNYEGTIFSVSTSGTNFNVIYSFGADNNDGGIPHGSLAVSGNVLYGTTSGYGTNYGTVFSVNADGSDFTVLHTFSSVRSLSPTTNSDGAGPYGGLILSGNTLYGTTQVGGKYGGGTVFSISTAGTNFTVLYNLTGGGGGGGSIGPYSGVTLCGDTLYGTTYSESNDGTVFSLNTNGSNFVTLYVFNPDDQPGESPGGDNPYAGVIVCGNILYGTAINGGSNGDGTVFSISLPFPPPLTVTVSGNQAIISWPTNNIVYSLQSATNLVPPVTWNPVLTTPILVNGQWVATNSTSCSPMFFRLSQ